MKTCARILAGGALVFALGCSTTDATQIVLAVDTDLVVPSEVDSLHIEVVGPGGARQTADIDLTVQTERPLTLGLRPAGQILEPVSIRASARLAGATVVEREIVTGFIRNKSLLLQIWLSSDCQGITCPSDQSCDGANCVAIAVAAASLPPFRSSIPGTGRPPADGGGDSCSGGPEVCNGVDDDCDGTIDNGFDLMTDRNNCGSCGHTCAGLTGVASASCAAGSCVLTCDAGFGDCDADPVNGCEANLNTDEANCSSCGTVCGFDHAADSCVAGVCAFGACDGGFADCDGDERNGCETDLSAPTNCGRCGHDCGGATCHASGFCEGEEIVAIAAGSQHSCGMRANGMITCWGLGAKGQLGTGANMSSRVPLPVMSLSNGDFLSAGGDQSCAISDGQVFCWGDNSGAQLGDGTHTSRNVPQAIVIGFGSFTPTQVSMGSAHACAIGDAGAGQTIRCWGINRNGQLGVDDTMDRTSPVAVDPTGTSLVDPVIVAASGRHSCAALADGQVYCWGAGTAGQLGVGTLTDQHLPVRVQDGSITAGFSLRTGMAPVTASSASLVTGNAFSCARDDGGQVYCWGDNSRGQLGDGTTITRRTLPARVSGLADAVALSAGDAHACALRADGRVSCWGANGAGQLGDGTMTDRSSPVDVMDAPADIAEVAAGAAHVCLRTMEGHVYCYGRNSVGQLGDGTVEPHVAPAPVSTLP